MIDARVSEQCKKTPRFCFAGVISKRDDLFREYLLQNGSMIACGISATFAKDFVYFAIMRGYFFDA